MNNKKIEVEIKSEDHFKSMLTDIMKETGINVKEIEITKEENNTKIEKEEVENIETEEKKDALLLEKKPEPIIQILEEKKEEELIEPIQEILKLEEAPIVNSIEAPKTVLSLNQLKEKSFKELKEELNNNENKRNQPNILKAGEVIKL